MTWKFFFELAINKIYFVNLPRRSSSKKRRSLKQVLLAAQLYTFLLIYWHVSSLQTVIYFYTYSSPSKFFSGKVYVSFLFEHNFIFCFTAQKKFPLFFSITSLHFLTWRMWNYYFFFSGIRQARGGRRKQKKLFFPSLLFNHKFLLLFVPKSFSPSIFLLFLERGRRRGLEASFRWAEKKFTAWFCLSKRKKIKFSFFLSYHVSKNLMHRNWLE